jgi:hypothetical protein
MDESILISMVGSEILEVKVDGPIYDSGARATESPAIDPKPRLGKRLIPTGRRQRGYSSSYLLFTPYAL